MANINATSVPGNGWMNQSADSAVMVRTGSMTTTLAPLARASSINGHRCRFVRRVLVPHRRINLLNRTSIGSEPNGDPNVSDEPTLAVAPQSASICREAPKRAKKRRSRQFICSRPWVPASPHGMIASPPSRAMISCRRAATMPSASSHVVSRNSAAPLRPVRTRGRRTRSGLYTRSTNRLTFGHSSPCEYGCSGFPRIFTATPSSTTTSQPQESGQS